MNTASDQKRAQKSEFSEQTWNRMVSSLSRDVDEHDQIGKYNPIGAGSFDYQTVKADLIELIERKECPEMDAVLDVRGSTEAYWNFP